MKPITKNIKVRVWIVLCTAFFLTAASCRKKEAVSPDKTESSCAIAKITNSEGQEIKIYYNTDGTYKTIENRENEYTITATYIGNTIILNISDNGTGKITSQNTILLNSKGVIYGQNIQYYDAEGKVTGSQNTVNEFDGIQMVKSTSSAMDPGSSKITTYSWSDGNLVSEVSDNYTNVYEYDLSKPAQAGDYFMIAGAMTGLDITKLIKNKNLLIGINGTPISYSFDPDGRITSLSKPDAFFYSIEYECN